MCQSPSTTNVLCQLEITVYILKFQTHRYMLLFFVMFCSGNYDMSYEMVLMKIICFMYDV